ncbi:hypothetical protein [Cyclobacterium jeungdonense]|uniref:Tetratricopeptide repeat protein n=1 Tax=Cyclobacterium jeungdonense TaxID=708087 RepID=A0ABT8C6K1_9BACT|nr:hypothetical protein [Cyclobacterium jeungdonense]MDN3687423.1 hypothetical protein [Cyclobacterium jeungdonense]
MNTDQFTSDFLPKEIVLKLYRDVPIWDYQQQIDLVNSYAETVKETMDPDVFDIKLHHQIGFCYWQADAHPQAIVHYKKVIEKLKPHHYPFLYFNVISLLIRCNRLIAEFSESFYWCGIAFKYLEATTSSFDKLNILTEYVDVLADANESFNKEYEPIIKYVIADLGFPETLTDPLETVNAMRTTNHIWNRKLSDVELSQVHLEDTDQIIRAFENFKQHCPIEWYRNYAENAINIRKHK